MIEIARAAGRAKAKPVAAFLSAMEASRVSISECDMPGGFTL